MRRSSGSLAALAAVVLLAIVSLGATVPDAPAHRAPTRADAPEMFRTAESCMACHNGLTTAAGEDVSIGTAWRATMMANSARDPYWQAAVRREILERPAAREEIEDECATCHMPMARYQARAGGRRGEVFAHLPVGARDGDEDLLAADGASCTLCHQITPDRLGDSASFTGGFVIDSTTPSGARAVFGPHAVDAGRQRIMHSASEFRPTEGAHIRASELCATCHTLYTNARDASGKVIGRFPEQVPFLEWKASRYAGSRSCQSCHMKAVAESLAISAVWGQPRPGLARHDFPGGNFFVLGMLGRYRTELGVEAPLRELDGAAAGARRFLREETATLAIDSVRVAGGRLEADVVVRNLTGHKLPTAYPSRRSWLHLTVKDAGGRVLFESGALGADGAIRGNDNDADSARFEPHYREIREPGQVQIYESILLSPDSQVTTGLISAIHYAKDNRLLPEGFDKRAAHPDVAVHGAAREDADFAAGGDRVRYAVDVSETAGPFIVEAELVYQPIGFRWAKNLGAHRNRHGAEEITRFLGYFDAMAHASSAVLARAVVSSR